jgi:hypothetical protein
VTSRLRTVNVITFCNSVSYRLRLVDPADSFLKVERADLKASCSFLILSLDSFLQRLNWKDPDPDG